MKIIIPFLLFFLFSFGVVFSQQSKIYTHNLLEYNRATNLYQNKDYGAAQIIFHKIKNQYDNASELKARAYYYEAFCAIRLEQEDGDDLMNTFFEKFPTSTKHNSAYLEVGNYYFNNGQYSYALKWFSKVDASTLSAANSDEFLFKKAYSLFSSGSYSNAKKYFTKVLNSPDYAAQAKYYIGYIAYKNDDFEEADRYLTEVSGNKKYDKEIPYYMANIKFKTGKFQEAINTALPILENSKGIQHSETSKIIGESYFNLKQFEKAIPHLLNYKGKKRRWNNTDYYQLGYAYYMQKDYENAMLWFTKIINGNNAVSQNAYYHLAECYLKSDKKQEALNAFRNAKQMNFDALIKKDAWLNYTKLSYEIGNPYKGTAEIIQEYIEAYPKDVENKEINNLLISAFISSNNYEGALTFLNKNKQNKTTEIYQKITHLYGIQLFNNQQFKGAIHRFNTSLSVHKNSDYTSKSLFWKAEANYRLNNFDEALADFDLFLKQNAQPKSESEIIHYNIAYTYFNLKKYEKAEEHFNVFIENSANKPLLIDSSVRLGDCYFALSNYEKSIFAYKKAAEKNNTEADYTQFQLAMCYGFTGNINKKITSLQNFTKQYPKSTLRDDAFYQLGNSYVQKTENNKALTAYDQVINEYRMSYLTPKAILKQGLIYYNNDQNQEALNKYKTVIKKYPTTAEAKEAVLNAKQIYMELGRVEEYETLIKNLDFIQISDSELDNTMFISAEQFYISNQYKKAINGFQKYLKRFPKGTNTLTAKFYLAQSYNHTKQAEKAIPYYTSVLEQSPNDFTEKALLNTAYYYLEKEDWENAVSILSRLELEANSQQNIVFAQNNLMKGNYALEHFDKAVKYAEIVLQNDKIDDAIKSDAEIIIARSAFKNGSFSKAETAFKKVEQTASGKLKAEAIYYDAYFKHKEGNYKVSNVAVQKLASQFSSYKYWGGKGLVIMAKNYYELQDAYQATYILESVIAKFSDYEDIMKEAKTELTKIKAEEAKTNSSIIIED